MDVDRRGSAKDLLQVTMKINAKSHKYIKLDVCMVCVAILEGLGDPLFWGSAFRGVDVALPVLIGTTGVQLCRAGRALSCEQIE